jgi:hypothetical protein
MHWKQAGVALGAGVASALLFVVSAKGTAVASLMAYFTALPVIIAALSFGHLSGLGGAIVGAGAVSLTTSPILGAFFIIFFALPGWWLSYLSGLARPAVAGAGVPVPLRGPPLLWYPVGRLVLWAAALSACAVLIAGAIALVHFGSFEETSQRLAARLEEALGEGTSSAPAASADTARFFVRILPVAMAASLCPMLSVNLWLGARIAELSQRLPRPWPNVPDGLRLPRWAAGLFIVILGPALLPGAIGTAAGVVAATLSVAFGFQGLAAAHILTRGFKARRGLLALIYLVTFVMPLAVVALTLIGVVDCLFSLRDRRPPGNTPLNPKGV